MEGATRGRQSFSKDFTVDFIRVTPGVTISIQPSPFFLFVLSLLEDFSPSRNKELCRELRGRGRNRANRARVGQRGDIVDYE